ncbi:chaplin family protein [Streptomyces sp. NBC_00365]|uniref:chaplin family protein n=1 Tax=Streptomyces sp. NBC_00365 TaxID=2975726 RepID=UPI00338E857C
MKPKRGTPASVRMPASRPCRSIPPGVASGNVILVPVVVLVNACGLSVVRGLKGPIPCPRSRPFALFEERPSFV